MTSYSDITALIASSAAIDLSDDTATLTVSQALALITAGVTFAEGDVVTISDTAANVQTLSAADIASLAAMGVSAVAASDGARALSVAQVNALATADMTASSVGEYEVTNGGVGQISPTVTADDATAAALANGGYVVTWASTSTDSDGGIVMQIYSDSGDASTSEIQVNSTVADAQNQPSVTALTNGGFVITWTSADQDGSSTGVFTQIFDQYGATVGDETQVNTYTSGAQNHPITTALSDGAIGVRHGRSCRNRRQNAQRH